MSAKKQLLLQTALTLFYQKGINNVGINEVLQVSGVAKKTLYNHFPTKEVLILATLVERDVIFMDWLTLELETALNDEALITQLFNALTRWFNDDVEQLSPFKGCFFINSSAEFRDKNHPINQQCQRHKQAVRALIKKHLSSDNKETVDMLCLLKEGAIVTASVTHDLDAANKCLPIALKALRATP